MTATSNGTSNPLEHAKSANEDVEAPKRRRVGPRLGVAVLVTNDENRLLLGRRGKEPNYGKLVIPGGGVKHGKTIAATASREIEEETGLKIELILTDGKLRVHVGEIIGDNEHRVILFVQAVVTGGELRASSDLLDARFYAKEEIPVDEVSPAVLPILREFGWA